MPWSSRVTPPRSASAPPSPTHRWGSRSPAWRALRTAAWSRPTPPSRGCSATARTSSSAGRSPRSPSPRTATRPFARCRSCRSAARSRSSSVSRTATGARSGCCSPPPRSRIRPAPRCAARSRRSSTSPSASGSRPTCVISPTTTRSPACSIATGSSPSWLASPPRWRATGDGLITRIGALLRDMVRTTDVVARLGGDEFIAILPEAGPEDAKRLATRILDAVRASGQITVGEEHAQITASIGLTSFDGDTGLTGAELVAEADVALYQAKAEGRNCRVLYDRCRPGRQVSAGAGSWTERLRDAVEQDRFVLHAQPIRGICADETSRYELLLRLRDVDGELIAPGAFLQNAERVNLMGEIDRWVLRRAVELIEVHER